MQIFIRLGERAAEFLTACRTTGCFGRIVRGDETAILCAAAQQHRRNVALDLRAVDAIDAAGIGVLISLQAAGIYLKLINPTRQVREILRITHVDSIFEICESKPSDEITEGCVTDSRSEPSLGAAVGAFAD